MMIVGQQAERLLGTDLRNKIERDLLCYSGDNSSQFETYFNNIRLHVYDKLCELIAKDSRELTSADESQVQDYILNIIDPWLNELASSYRSLSTCTPSITPTDMWILNEIVTQERINEILYSTLRMDDATFRDYINQYGRYIIDTINSSSDLRPYATSDFGTRVIAPWIRSVAAIRERNRLESFPTEEAPPLAVSRSEVPTARFFSTLREDPQAFRGTAPPATVPISASHFAQPPLAPPSASADPQRQSLRADWMNHFSEAKLKEIAWTLIVKPSTINPADSTSLSSFKDYIEHQKTVMQNQLISDHEMQEAFHWIDCCYESGKSLSSQIRALQMDCAQKISPGSLATIVTQDAQWKILTHPFQEGEYERYINELESTMLGQFNFSINPSLQSQMKNKIIIPWINISEELRSSTNPREGIRPEH